MPARSALLAALDADDAVGVLLVAQMGGAPNELQLIVQTATYDATVEGLREGPAHIVRALGVREHRLSLGVFPGRALFFAEAHPLLHHHNAARTTVTFTGPAPHPEALALDVLQAHASTFGPFRELAQDINRAAPLLDLLAQPGAVLLGTMPRPAAERMARVLAHHNIPAALEDVEPARATDEHGRAQSAQLLGLGDSYVVALAFSVDALGRGSAPARP